MMRSDGSCRRPILAAGPAAESAAGGDFAHPADTSAIATVSMLTSHEARCGVAAYSRHLVAALERHLAVTLVPATFRPSGASVYAAMGRALNGGQVAHVQHAYGFWGGMRPRRGGFAACLRETRVPLVVTVHEFDGRSTGASHLPAALERAYKRWFNRRSFLSPAIGAWICHSEPLRAGLVELGADLRRVHCLPMPVPDLPPPIPSPEAAKAGLAFAGQRVLTILGFLSRRKGYDLAIRALPQLDEGCVLLCAGGEHYADRNDTAAWIRAEAGAAGVADRVRITGFLSDDELSRAVAASDLVLAPFTEMSASASVSLALAYGKPVLASDLAPNRALGCLALFPSGDVSALAAAIRLLLADPAERDRYVRLGNAYREEHTFERLAARTIEIYHGMLR